MKMNSKLKKGLNGFLAPNASSTTQNGHSNRRDHDSPYRRFVVTTELRSDPKQHSKFVRYVSIDSYFLNLGTAGGKRGFLRGGFTLVGVGGLQAGTHLGGTQLEGSSVNNQFMSPFDWDLSSAAQPHVPNDSKGLTNGLSSVG
jgi:hypothetical protein